MKFQRIIEAVYFQPWAITREGWQAVHSILKPYLDGKEPPALSQDEPPETDIFGNPMPKMEITPAGVAIIPVVGTLLHHATLLDKMCGACSYDDIKTNLRAAVGTVGVNKIVLNFDSPGGMSMGNDECAAVVAECAEFTRVEAVTDSLMCSAAYLLAAPCHQISCTPTAQVGAIGCLLPWMDQTVRYEMAGLKVKMFSDGEYKGAGWPGTQLTEKQTAYFQSLVDKYGSMFKAVVQKNRVVDDASMQGQVFIGSDALDAGLVDEIIDDVEDRFEPAEPDEVTTED